MNAARSLRVAAIQMNSREDKEWNIQRAEVLIDRAAALGARLVALPEYFNYLGPGEGVKPNAEPIPGPTIERLAAKARQHALVLHCGSIPERVPDSDRSANTSVVLGPDGGILGIYRKIHLFDVEVGGQPAYRESDSIVPGKEAVVVDTPVARLGLTICYDLRFPELFRTLTLQGAEIILTPAAFTLYTGKDHWEVLQRARAIENQVFIVAPAQFGNHAPNRSCYGNAMIVDPWGTVLARAPEEDTVVVADLDFDYRARVQEKLPSLRHRRPGVYG